MSETATTAESEAPAQAATEQESPKQETDWKAEARKWEQRAKEYKPAADKLAEIEEATKTEAQRAAERIAAAERKAAEAEAKTLRREIALEHSLSKGDAALLDGVTDESAMRRLAERLAAQSEPRKQRNHAPREGGNPNTGDNRSDEREFVRNLFGSAD